MMQWRDDVDRQITTLASVRYAPLTRLCGVDLLTARMLAGLLGPGQRFESDAQLAAYAGVAPIEDRRLNSIVYRIVLTQARHSEEAKAYLARRISQGKTRREAHRALRRYIVRVPWHLWRECHLAGTAAELGVAA